MQHPSIAPQSLRLRPAAERFQSRLPWLESWHSFSFASHYDPDWTGHGPLRVINDDTIAPGQGFGMHPHHDMEIVTVMLDGELTHEDSMGNRAVIQAGEVQRMSAGSGVVHSEMNHSTNPCRLLQIWVTPQRAGGEPAYEQKAFSVGPGWTPLLDPQRLDGAMALQQQVRLWRARPEMGDRLNLPMGFNGLGWLQLVDGAVAMDDQLLQRGDGVGFGTGEIRELVAAAGADLLLFELQ